MRSVFGFRGSCIKAHGSFCHCSNVNVEGWICYIIKLPIEVTRVNASVFRSSDPAFFPALIPRSASCCPGLILVLWGVYGQIILPDLIWSFIRIMLTGGTRILSFGDDHRD